MIHFEKKCTSIVPTCDEESWTWWFLHTTKVQPLWSLNHQVSLQGLQHECRRTPLNKTTISSCAKQLWRYEVPYPPSCVIPVINSFLQRMKSPRLQVSQKLQWPPCQPTPTFCPTFHPDFSFRMIRWADWSNYNYVFVPTQSITEFVDDSSNFMVRNTRISIPHCVLQMW